MSLLHQRILPGLRPDGFSHKTWIRFSGGGHHCFKGSITRNKELILLFESISNGNLRTVLQYISNVITSGHLDTRHILERINETGNYTLSRHQTLRAILYGDNHYYDPQRPPFINLYDANYADPLEHFVKPICLFTLDQTLSQQSKNKFVKIDDLVAQMGVYTFDTATILSTIESLFHSKCLEDAKFNGSWEKQCGQVRITALGRYHLYELMGYFTYLDAVIPDMPILDEKIRNTIVNAQDLNSRLRRARIVLRYLDKCAEHTIGRPFNDHWHSAAKRLGDEITEIEARNQE